MGYVNILEENEDRLHFRRDPSNKAWAILVGFTSVGFGAAYYCHDIWLWKFLYVATFLFVGVSCFETWEECILDKKEKKVKLKVQNLLQKTIPSVSTNIVSADLDDLLGVHVSDEDVKYAGKGYHVILVFRSGIQLGVTDTLVVEDKSEFEAIAEKIYKFAELDKKEGHDNEFIDDIEVLGDHSSEDSDAAIDESLPVMETISHVAESIVNTTINVFDKEIQQAEALDNIAAVDEPETQDSEVTSTTLDDPPAIPSVQNGDQASDNKRLSDRESSDKTPSLSDPDSDDSFEKIDQAAVAELDENQ